MAAARARAPSAAAIKSQRFTGRGFSAGPILKWRPQAQRSQYGPFRAHLSQNGCRVLANSMPTSPQFRLDADVHRSR